MRDVQVGIRPRLCPIRSLLAIVVRAARFVPLNDGPARLDPTRPDPTRLGPPPSPPRPSPIPSPLRAAIYARDFARICTSFFFFFFFFFYNTRDSTKREAPIHPRTMNRFVVLSISWTMIAAGNPVFRITII